MSGPGTNGYGPAGTGGPGGAPGGNGAPWEPVGASRELHLAKAGRARKARLRRRRLLLLAAVPFVLVGLVLGFKLAFLPVIASSAATAYAEGDYRRAVDAFRGQQTLNIVEPWKAHFNTGTALVRDERFYPATRALHEAYEVAEGEDAEVRCTIKTNLSLAYELEGDDNMRYGAEIVEQIAAVQVALDARDAGLPYDEDLVDASGSPEDLDTLREDAAAWFEYAERSYGTADQVRRWPDCEDLGEEQDEIDEQARQRLEDKSQEAQDARSDADEPEDPDGGQDGDDGEDEEPDDSENPDDPDGENEGENDEQAPDGGQTEEERQAEQERQERLEQQNTEARQEQDELEQMYGDLYGGQGGSGTDTGNDGGGGTKRW